MSSFLDNYDIATSCIAGQIELYKVMKIYI